jgi:hypothetical protein
LGGVNKDESAHHAFGGVWIRPAFFLCSRERAFCMNNGSRIGLPSSHVLKYNRFFC